MPDDVSKTGIVHVDTIGNVLERQRFAGLEFSLVTTVVTAAAVTSSSNGFIAEQDHFCHAFLEVISIVQPLNNAALKVLATLGDVLHKVVRVAQRLLRMPVSIPAWNQIALRSHDDDGGGGLRYEKKTDV